MRAPARSRRRGIRRRRRTVDGDRRARVDDDTRLAHLFVRGRNVQHAVDAGLGRRFREDLDRQVELLAHPDDVPPRRLLDGLRDRFVERRVDASRDDRNRVARRDPLPRLADDAANRPLPVRHAPHLAELAAEERPHATREFPTFKTSRLMSMCES